MGKSVSSSVVGLDIGTEMMKVAEARLAKDGIHITGLGIAPTPLGAVDNSAIVDAEALGAAIKQLLRESGIRAKQVVSIITGQSSVVVRIIEVPKMAPEELKETMTWEVERHVPFSPTEIVMDFAPVEKPNPLPDAQSMEVLLAVAQEEAVNSHVKALFAAGLEPVAIDVQPLAVSRALINSADGSQPGTVAIVNIGATSTEVGVYEGGILAFPGSFPIAGVNFTRAISEALGVPTEEADRLKKEFAVAESVGPAGWTAGGLYDTGFDAGVEAAEPVPTAHDTSYPAADERPQEAAGEQAESDFSPFDLGSTPGVAPRPSAEQEDVFDLGGRDRQEGDFKPVFDLDDPEVQPEGAVPADTSAAGEGGAAAAGPEPVKQEMQTAPQAEPAQQHAGAQDDILRDISNAIAPVLTELATEVRRSIEYYVTRYHSRPEQIYLCGGSAKMRGLDTFLANELGIPVVVADPTANFAVNCPRFSPQYLSEISPLFPVSIGLAIRDMLD